jgi:hypothetical protein
MKEDINYRLCAFAFLDILGFKNIVTEIGDDIQKAETFIRTLISLIEGSEKTLSSFCEANVQYQIFSDSICIWINLDEDENFTDKFSYQYIEKCYNAILALCMIVSSIQRRGIYEGLLFRGAISIGYHYHHRNVTFSQAMVAAYMAESKESIYPRVILMSFDDRFILTALLDSLVATGYATEDDWVYVDYLNTVYGSSFMEQSIIEDFFNSHKDIIEKGLEKYKNDEKIFIKYQWLARYHNKRLRPGYEKYMIDIKDVKADISNEEIWNDPQNI